MSRAEQRHVLARGRAQRLFVALALLSLACSKGAPPAASPEEPSSKDAQTPSPETAAPPASKVLALGALGAGVPAPPASCPAATPLPKERKACEGALSSLAAGVQAVSPAAQALMVELEACAEFPAGIVRALRAEAQPACADKLVEPVVGADAAPDQVDAPTRELLVALGVASRLSRLVGAPPRAAPKSSRAVIEAYLRDEVMPWATEQAVAIGDSIRIGASMKGYARGIVAIEAALADLRFVEMMRALPLPVEMEDPEIQAEYYASLDQVLEPRKDRARDAALVGLGEFSALGILQSRRLTQAREVISRVFAGNRILALDTLLTPKHPHACTRSVPQEVVAADVDTPYAPLLLGEQALAPALTACLLQRGLSAWLARQLEAGDAEGRLALARGYFELGRTYLAAAGFQRAAQVYGDLRSSGARLTAEQELLAALSTVLSAAPVSVVDLFRIGPRLPSALGRVTPLDEVAKSHPKVSGPAGFDAAYLLELTAPDGSASHFVDVAKRYDAAARKLAGKERSLATERAAAARATAAALQKQLN